MSIAVSHVLAPLKPCFQARPIVRMALRRLTEKKHSSSDEFNQEIVILILPHGYPFYPQTLVKLLEIVILLAKVAILP